MTTFSQHRVRPAFDPGAHPRDSHSGRFADKVDAEGDAGDLRAADGRWTFDIGDPWDNPGVTPTPAMRRWRPASSDRSVSEPDRRTDQHLEHQISAHIDRGSEPDPEGADRVQRRYERHLLGWD